MRALSKIRDKERENHGGEEIIVQCDCAEDVEPTRQHFTWNCPNRPLDIRPPVNDSEASMLVRLVPRWQRERRSYEEEIDAISLSDVSRTEGRICIATDGGARAKPVGVATWAIAVLNDSGNKVHSGTVKGGDRSSYMTELTALWVAAKVVEKHKAKATVATDNQKLARQFQAGQNGFPPNDFQGVRIWLDILNHTSDTLQVVWIPSPGKNSPWEPPDCGTPEMWRQLNGGADSAARPELTSNEQRVNSYTSAIDEAEEWVEKAFLRQYNYTCELRVRYPLKHDVHEHDYWLTYEEQALGLILSKTVATA